jgi:hypothetical protein
LVVERFGSLAIAALCNGEGDAGTEHDIGAFCRVLSGGTSKCHIRAARLAA